MHIRRTLIASALFASLAIGYAFVAPDSHDQEKVAPVPAGTYTVDSVHSCLLFKLKRSGASWFFGRFDEPTGTITVAPDAPEKTTVQFEVKTQNVDTGNSKRDDHLRSGDFFDAKQFPTATFKSKSVAKSGDGFKVTGALTMHGIAKDVTFDVQPTGVGKGMDGEVIAGYYATLAIKRSDFGIKTYPEVLGDEVTLMISLACNKN